MKKNVFISNALSKPGTALASVFKLGGYYVYGTDTREDYEGVCDRSLRFDLAEFVADAGYRVRFTQIFDEITPRLDVLVFCPSACTDARLANMPLDYWHRTLHEGVTGPMLLSKLFLPRLEKSNGAILFLTTKTPENTSVIDIAHQTAQAAMQGLMQAFCQDFQTKVRTTALSVLPDLTENESLEPGYWQETARLAHQIVSMEQGTLNGAVIPLHKMGLSC